MQRRHAIRRIILLTIVIFAVLIIIDRYYWAQISQWREDQAANLWLGYTGRISNIPVGLISSQNIPNPNGMILLGILLSRLPNLLSVSLFLSLMQTLLVVLVGWKASAGSWQYFALSALPVLSSVILRSSSVEFWNQYTITLVNIFFLFWALRYLEKPSLWNLPPIAILILLAPSLYLAGAVNAIVMSLLSFGMVLYRRPDWKHVWPVAAVIGSILVVSIGVTWWPYFQSVSLGQLATISKGPYELATTPRTFWETLFGIPIFGTLQWADQAVFTKAFKHTNEAILTQSAKILLSLTGRVYLFQTVFAFATALYAIYRVIKYGVPRSGNFPAVHIPSLRLVILSILFVSLCFAIGVWVGGQNWLNGERPDQIVQFLPMFLFFIFLLPVSNRIEGRVGRVITGISYFLLALFVTVNLLCGFLIVRDHLQYRGNVVSEADIPLSDKEQAVDFIARDWKNHTSSSVIPVDYDLGGERWDWIPRFGRKLAKWYPAPMTLGRSFDYELLRRYRLTNVQEGIQLRSFGEGRYLLTYAFEDPPQVKTGQSTHYLFGRLRVTIVEK